jgi:hypothetical protein
MLQVTRTHLRSSIAVHPHFKQTTLIQQAVVQSLLCCDVNRCAYTATPAVGSCQHHAAVVLLSTRRLPLLLLLHGKP